MSPAQHGGGVVVDRQCDKGGRFVMQPQQRIIIVIIQRVAPPSTSTDGDGTILQNAGWGRTKPRRVLPNRKQCSTIFRSTTVNASFSYIHVPPAAALTYRIPQPTPNDPPAAAFTPSLSNTTTTSQFKSSSSFCFSSPTSAIPLRDFKPGHTVYHMGGWLLAGWCCYCCR